MDITNQIQTHILNHLINDEEYCRRVIPFLKKEYFESTHKVVFDLIVNFVTEHNKIPSGKIFASAVAISGALATSAGALLGSFYLLKPDRGLDPMMTAIVVVVFGGLGSIKGTIIAAYIVGFIQAFVALTIGIKWSLPVLFAFMIVVLIFRPYGLYGESQQKRI